MINKEWAFKILNLYFHSRTIYLDREELSRGVDKLMKDDIIMPQDEQKVKINLKSDLFYEILLEYIENKSDRNFPRRLKKLLHGWNSLRRLRRLNMDVEIL